MRIRANMILRFKRSLKESERSGATVEKYIRDVSAFYSWLEGREIDRNVLVEYKSYLVSVYAPKSVNSIISSLNGFFAYMEWHNLRIKTLKIQKRIFTDREKELTRDEYERLLKAAKEDGNDRLFCLMQTICATGIRVSELKHITAEAVSRGQAQISCKGKMRYVIIPKKLCRLLRRYMKKHSIITGSVFITRTGNPLDRSNIWSDMKKLCKKAGVGEKKVFPHNLRHLFARTYYSLEKDIVRLADILGHSSINTTRIYTIESGDVHRRQLDRMCLLMC